MLQDVFGHNWLLAYVDESPSLPSLFRSKITHSVWQRVTILLRTIGVYHLMNDDHAANSDQKRTKPEWYTKIKW